MKYQSEIVKEIIDSRGHEKSSLHYQSECIESWIDENKGSYPKLCDYEGEWLNYINENPIGEFPYETLTDVTKATINNVVPYEYKSAILSGMTLVNLSRKSTSDVQTIISSNNSMDIDLRYKLKNSTVYTAIFNVLTTESPSDSWCGFMGTSGWGSNSVMYSMGINKIKFTTLEDSNCSRFRIRGLNNTFKNLIILEGNYTNVDIPYFEGMQSVRMPVLTTTGKNLFDKNQNNLNKGIMPSTWSDMGIDFIFKSGTYYAKDDISNVKYDEYLIDGSINKDLAGSNGITVTDNTLKIRIKLFRTKNDATFEEHYETFRIGTSFEDIVSYEPYKSNILTVNEEVTLRSNGDICDELNLLTGQLTQRIGEDGVVLSQEVVKTVGLSVVNQDGTELSKIKPIEGTMHITTSGTPINPLFSGEIPVEAITQNLASFIEE